MAKSKPNPFTKPAAKGAKGAKGSKAVKGAKAPPFGKTTKV